MCRLCWVCRAGFSAGLKSCSMLERELLTVSYAGSSPNLWQASVLAQRQLRMIPPVSGPGGQAIFDSVDK